MPLRRGPRWHSPGWPERCPCGCGPSHPNATPSPRAALAHCEPRTTHPEHADSCAYLLGALHQGAGAPAVKSRGDRSRRHHQPSDYLGLHLLGLHCYAGLGHWMERPPSGARAPHVTSLRTCKGAERSPALPSAPYTALPALPALLAHLHSRPHTHQSACPCPSVSRSQCTHQSVCPPWHPPGCCQPGSAHTRASKKNYY